MKKITIGFILAVLILPAHSIQDSSLSYYTPEESPDTLILETTHFTVHYREDYAIVAQEAADIAESLYDDAVAFMGYTPQEKMEIHIYSSSFVFTNAVQADTRGFTLFCRCPFSTEPLGMIPSQKELLVAIGLSSALFLKMATIDAKILNEAQLWLSGIPHYFALRDENEMAVISIHVLRETDNLPTSLDEITFENYGMCAYPLSYTAVKYIFDEYGEEKFHAFLRSLDEWNQAKTTKENVDTALMEAFGVTREEFEQGWRAYIQGFPVLEEKCDAVQITDSWGHKVPSSWHNGKILYTAPVYISEWDKSLDIFVMNADGSGAHNLSDHVATDCDPKFSPDGSKIAFTSLRDEYEYANIYIMDADGSNVQQVTFEKAMDYMGSWSPDGEKIAFTSGRSGNYDVYIMNADGSGIQQVTTYEGDDGWPVFSPDGQKILFVSERNGSYDLYVMNTDGTGVTQLTTTPAHENYPQYSPDGTQIAFVSSEKTAEICVMNSDGTNREVVLSQPVFFMKERTMPTLIGYPVWSPDGTEIAVIIGTELFTIPVNHDVNVTWAIVLVVVLAGVAVILWRVIKK